MELENIKKKEVEKLELDLTQYVGKKTKIEAVEILTKEFKGEKSYYAKVSGGVVDEIEKKNGETVQLRPSKVLGLSHDKNDEGKDEVFVPIGYKTDKFLKSLKCEDLYELKGKEVTIQLTEPNEDGKRFLTF